MMVPKLAWEAQEGGQRVETVDGTVDGLRHTECAWLLTNRIPATRLPLGHTVDCPSWGWGRLQPSTHALKKWPH